MTHHLEKLIIEIQTLERAVSEKIIQSVGEMPFDLKDGRAIYDDDLRRQHRGHAKSIKQYLFDSTMLTILTAPIIYSLVIPITLLDLFVSVYQRVCFPVYGIPRVHRKKYVVIDRHQLEYLNAIEKLNCVYCGYANGVLTYARQIAARTEQYWCPIKHSRRVEGCHTRQCLFCQFGDAEGYRRELEHIRNRFSDLD